MRYLQTSNPERIVALTYEGGEIWADVLEGHVDPFSAVKNVLTPRAMRKAREAAKEAGLRLREPQRVFTRAFVEEVE